MKSLTALIFVALIFAAGWYAHALSARLDDHDQHMKFIDSMMQQQMRLGAASRGGVIP